MSSDDKGQPGWLRDRRGVLGVFALALVTIGVGVGIGAAVWSGGSASARTSRTPVSNGVSSKTVVTSPGNVGDETPHSVEGKTTGDPEDTKLEYIHCPSGEYLEADSQNRGTIFDKMRIDVDLYNSSGILWTWGLTDSVEWGRIGSRLATGVELGFENKHLYHNPLPYAATMYCTNDKSAAWVVVG